MEVKTLQGKVVVLDNPNQYVGYANVTGISVSTDEVILHFGQRNINNLKEGIGIAKIYLGLPHAKRLVTALNEAIRQYESVFGEIVADPGTKLSPEEKEKLGIK